MNGIVQARTGALSILAICFFASASLRAGDVLAELPALRTVRESVAERLSDRLDANDLEQSRAYRELARQRAELEERAQTLNQRAEELSEIESRMATRLEQLQIARDLLAAETARARDAAEEDVAHLAKMYEELKPKVAGKLFDRMDPVFAAGFLSRMRPEAGAAVIGSMQPERAYAVSVILASRNLGLSTARIVAADSAAGLTKK